MLHTSEKKPYIYRHSLSHTMGIWNGNEQKNRRKIILENTSLLFIYTFCLTVIWKFRISRKKMESYSCHFLDSTIRICSCSVIAVNIAADDFSYFIYSPLTIKAPERLGQMGAFCIFLWKQAFLTCSVQWNCPKLNELSEMLTRSKLTKSCHFFVFKFN